MPSESRIEHDLVMVNDDKPLLQLTPDGWLAHGTPWSGKHSRNSRPGDPDFDTPAAFPLRAIVVIKRGETNTIRRLSPNEAADQFFAQPHFPSTLIPHGGEAPSGREAFPLRLSALELMGRLAQIPVYELRCTISQEAVELTLQALRESCGEVRESTK